jgi:hypothetical protein
VRAPDGTGSPTHVLVIAELGAPERRRFGRSRRPAEPQPAPAPVSTGRATIIDLARALPDAAAARDWLQSAGEPELEIALELLNRALHGLRLILADPDRHEVAREQLLVARVGYGAGEEVADGLWTDARELVLRPTHQSRQRVLQPQARLAALLAGRERALVCEELTLRARGDLQRGREREAALGLLVALDAALTELPREPQVAALGGRIDELGGQRDAVADAAQAALAGPLPAAARETVGFVLGRIEAALRARAVAST